MKNKKILIGVIIAILVIVAIVALVYLYIQNKNEEKVTTLGKIELLVVDQTDQLVIGAGVDLLVGDDVQGSVETGTDGKVKFYTVPVGPYTLKATTAPEGYSVNGEKVEFSVNGGETATVTLPITRNVPRLVITVENEQGETLKDAEIDFYNENGEYVTTLLAYEDGIVARNLDGNGVYYIKQSKTQEGYVIDDTSYRVTIDGEDDFTFYTTIVNKKSE